MEDDAPVIYGLEFQVCIDVTATLSRHSFTSLFPRLTTNVGYSSLFCYSVCLWHAAAYFAGLIEKYLVNNFIN